jgi:hypothetical protein
VGGTKGEEECHWVFEGVGVGSGLSTVLVLGGLLTVKHTSIKRAKFKRKQVDSR